MRILSTAVSLKAATAVFIPIITHKNSHTLMLVSRKCWGEKAFPGQSLSDDVWAAFIEDLYNCTEQLICRHFSKQNTFIPLEENKYAQMFFLFFRSSRNLITQFNIDANKPEKHLLYSHLFSSLIIHLF